MKSITQRKNNFLATYNSMDMTIDNEKILVKSQINADTEMIMKAWNLKKTYRKEAVKNLEEVIKEHTMDLIDVHETHIKETAIIKLQDCILY